MELRIQSSCGKKIVLAYCNTTCMQFVLYFQNFINMSLEVSFHLLKSFACCNRLFIIHCMFKTCYMVVVDGIFFVCFGFWFGFWFGFFQVKQFFLCASPTYLLNYLIKKAVETCPVQCYSDGSFNQVPM